jgi:sporulation protein YlmC with PRC-barrel domain
MTTEPAFNDDGDRRASQVLGQRVVSEHGETIGRVNDVLIDEAATERAWAVVSTGLLRSEHFVPLGEAYVGIDGNVVVPYEKNTVKKAPRADEHVLTAPVREKLAAYYGTS